MQFFVHKFSKFSVLEEILEDRGNNFQFSIEFQANNHRKLH